MVGENRKLLIFPLDEVPEMARGQGVYLQQYKDGGLIDATSFAWKDGLKDENGRLFEPAELKEWRGERAQAGRIVPRGWSRGGKFGGQLSCWLVNHGARKAVPERDSGRHLRYSSTVACFPVTCPFFELLALSYLASASVFAMAATLVAHPELAHDLVRGPGALVRMADDLVQPFLIGQRARGRGTARSGAARASSAPA